jgi:hypothetical protein
MNGFAHKARRAYRGLLLAVGTTGIVTLLALLPSSASAGSGPGSWSQAQVNQAIANGVGYFDANQNSDGSWGSSYLGAETSLALASYGVLDSGKFANLSPAQQTRVTNGLKFLLGTQGASGSFDRDGLQTYDTGLALVALSLNTDNPTYQTQIATAITNARNDLIGSQNVTGNGGLNCTTAGPPAATGNDYCGGWDYNGPDARSDESNTGFALTGLDVTGGVPTAVATANVGWQRNVQNLDVNGGTTNAGGWPSRNDGGGSYQPAYVGSTSYVSSNANDSGSLVFGLGYDKVPATDPAVVAAVKFGNDILDTYEMNKSTPTMVYHTGINEEPACVIGQPNCNWQFGPSFEGGYHYSIFALVKGLSQYGGPSLSDPNNFYAKAVDLLLSQQQSDGSWPQDGRDDASVIGATGFAILALGKVGALEQQISASGMSVSATEGHSFSGGVAKVNDPDATASPSEYTATIDWGDGTKSSGHLTGTNGDFTVVPDAAHTYAEEGSFTIKVTVTDTDTPDNTASASSTAKVADAALSASGASPSRSGNAVTGSVATFTDSDPNGTKSDYTAAITWGDGSMSAGTVSASGGKFSVNGSHTYSKPGTYTITTTIKDIGGSTATAKTTVTIPTQHVKAARVSARLSSAPACVSGAFVSRVSGTRIASVRFTLDGRNARTRTIQRGKRYSARMSVSPGRHSLTVNVRFRSGSAARSRTFHQTVRGCPPPTFTG